MASSAEYNRRWYAKNRDAHLAKRRATYAANIEKFRQKGREQHQKHREVRVAASKAYYWEHREQMQANWKRWQANNKERLKLQKRNYNLKTAFGITLVQRDELLALQGNKCAICPATSPGTKRDWHTDHCHDTGKVRGILCHACNVSLGHAKDNIATLTAMIKYLKRHGK
jgi:hypothetical protein